MRDQMSLLGWILLAVAAATIAYGCFYFTCACQCRVCAAPDPGDQVDAAGGPIMAALAPPCPKPPCPAPAVPWRLPDDFNGFAEKCMGFLRDAMPIVWWDGFTRGLIAGVSIGIALCLGLTLVNKRSTS